VVRENDQSTPDAKALDRDFEPLRERVGFVVDGDPERLEDECGWIVSATAPDPGARDHLAKIGGRPQGRALAGCDDDARELSRSGEVRIIRKPLLELLEARATQQVRGGRSRSLVHAHVEWGLCCGLGREAESALRGVELMRRDSEIE
jgi:hypothetical protein